MCCARAHGSVRSSSSRNLTDAQAACVPIPLCFKLVESLAASNCFQSSGWGWKIVDSGAGGWVAQVVRWPMPRRRTLARRGRGCVRVALVVSPRDRLEKPACGDDVARLAAGLFEQVADGRRCVGWVCILSFHGAS